MAKIKFQWERIDQQTERAKVIGGWIVWSFGSGDNGSMVFVPDPKHEWICL